MNHFIQKLQGDKVIWMVAFFLATVSLLAVYSSVSTLAVRHDGSTASILIKHGCMLAVGFGLMYYMHRMHYKYFSRISMILIWVAVVLLVYTLLFGSNLNNADRWIRLPVIGLTFQTSDFAKIVLVLYVARQLSMTREHPDDFRSTMVPVLVPVVAVCGLILPANFSTAFILAFVCFLMMYFAGVAWKHLRKLVLAGFAGLLLLVAVGETFPGVLPRYTTWKNRVLNKVEDNEAGNFQVDMAKAAIKSGGLLPSLPGNSSFRNRLPHPYSDMIYAFIIEEYGSLLGGLGMLLLYLILLYRTVKFVRECPRAFGSLAALGLAFLMVVQAMVNMGVAVDLFPTTGQPLPLVSLGGTSTVLTCMMIGIILSVSRSKFNSEETGTEGESPAAPAPVS